MLVSPDWGLKSEMRLAGHQPELQHEQEFVNQYIPVIKHIRRRIRTLEPCIKAMPTIMGNRILSLLDK